MLTLLVGTKNRSDHVIALLRYYAALDFPYTIAIGDSSDATHQARIKQTIQQLSGKLSVQFIDCPDMLGPEAIKKLLDHTVTPYALYTGDDDFFVPETLTKGIQFLEKNPDYVGINGPSVIFSSTPQSGWTIGQYGLRGIDQDTAAARFAHFFSHYFVSLFSLFRTEVLQRMYHHIGKTPIPSFQMTAFSGELLPCGLSAILGKIKQLDHLYLLHQVHPGQRSLFGLYEWITDPDWGSSYRLFHEALVTALIEKEPLPKARAEAIVKQAFWAYLSHGLVNKYEATYRHVSPLKSKMRQTVFWRFAKNMHDRLFCRRYLSLVALLSKRSPYHHDFVRVHEAINAATENCL